MRVLHVISSIDPRAGGPSSALVGLTEAQRRAGLEVSVVSTYTADESPDPAERLKSAKIDAHMIGPTSGKLKRHPDLAKKIDELVTQADVVHIHALWEEIQHQAARSARRRKKPYVIRPCGMLDPWSLRQSAGVKKIYMLWRLRRDLQRAAALHFTSEIERDLTKELKLRAPAIVEPNGVDLREFQYLPARGSFRRRYDEIGYRPMVLFLSRLHPKKGLELLIPAFAQAAKDQEMLVIAGPDSDGYQAKIEKMVAEHGIKDRVIFAGMLRGPERVAAYTDADLFVLPSHQENFGIVVAEALAAGTAVIVSDQVNIHPQISASQLGAVVPLDVNALAEQMRKWLADPQLRRAAGERARAIVCEKYDWEKIARRWGEHYLRILAKPQAATKRPSA
jgi:glycosyltransferase involved in cell wall biosynthesis